LARAAAPETAQVAFSRGPARQGKYFHCPQYCRGERQIHGRGSLPLFDIARGSALESAVALDALRSKGRCSEEEILPGKERLWRIVSMLVGLIKAHSDYRLHDDDDPE
jgi:hypothetical protein